MIRKVVADPSSLSSLKRRDRSLQLFPKGSDQKVVMGIAARGERPETVPAPLSPVRFRLPVPLGVQGHVPSDAVEVGSHAAGGRPLGTPPPRPDERLLHDILCAVGVLHDPGGVCDQVRPLGLEESAERPPVSGTNPLHEKLIGSPVYRRDFPVRVSYECNFRWGHPGPPREVVSRGNGARSRRANRTCPAPTVTYTME